MPLVKHIIAITRAKNYKSLNLLKLLRKKV